MDDSDGAVATLANPTPSRNGTTLPIATVERFWAKVDRQPGGCWEWRACLDRDGYGKFAYRSLGRQTCWYAHRLAYELTIGPIPEGLTLDHVCRNRRCVHPGHLDPVPNRVNLLRGVGFIAVQARRTHCIAGHVLDGDNCYRWRGHRYCKTCRRSGARRYYARRRAA